MTPYLKGIWNRCVRRYRLKNELDSSECRIASRDTGQERTGGKQNYRLDGDGKLYCSQVTGVENAPATARLENMLDRYVGRAQPRCSKP